MGDLESGALASGESSLGYHPSSTRLLTPRPEAGRRTMSDGQFDWGGRLPKSNGGAQRFPQAVWKSAIECKGIRELDCERDISSRHESGA